MLKFYKQIKEIRREIYWEIARAKHKASSSNFHDRYIIHKYYKIVRFVHQIYINILVYQMYNDEASVNAVDGYGPKKVE